jgi:hypothetical protein
MLRCGSVCVCADTDAVRTHCAVYIPASCRVVPLNAIMTVKYTVLHFIDNIFIKLDDTVNQV